MASKKISDRSRYRGTDLYRIYDQLGLPTNNAYFGVWKRPEPAPGSDDIYHRVSDIDIGRLDLLAYYYYRDPLLWWVIADANSITDQFTELVAGEEILIPALPSVLAAITSK